MVPAGWLSRLTGDQIKLEETRGASYATPDGSSEVGFRLHGRTASHSRWSARTCWNSSLLVDKRRSRSRTVIMPGQGRRGQDSVRWTLLSQVRMALWQSGTGAYASPAMLVHDDQ
jgi:hypothetical protein